MSAIKLNRAELQERQLYLLRSLLSAVFDANPFYQRKYQALGLTPEIASQEDFKCRFPFTVKQELAEDQRQNPPFGSDLTYPLNCYIRCHQTSSTSGTPLRWLDTAESWQWMLENWKQVYRAAGIGKGDRLFFAFSFGPFLGLWTAFDAALQMGGCCFPGGGVSSLARLKTIMELGVNALCCTPSYALHLAEVAAREKLDLSGSPVRHLIVAGEPGGSVPATRRRLELLWPGAKVHDHHGMTEVGPVSYECPRVPGRLHVIESAFIPEVIDPLTLAPVQAGEAGELVLTTLRRVGSPLIRYRTGDRVQPAPLGDLPCACGSLDLALEGGITGRLDDMVIIRGVNVFPSAVEEIIRACPGVAEYRVRVMAGDGLAEMQVEIEPEETANWNDLRSQELASRLQSALALRVPVLTAPCGSLPRFEGKGRRWLKTSEPASP